MSISDNEDVLRQAMWTMGRRGGLKAGKHRGPRDSVGWTPNGSLTTLKRFGGLRGRRFSH